MSISTERSWTKAWALVIAGATVAEFRALRAKRNECTLSYATRIVFRTDTRSGRLGFSLAWLAFSAWWVPHVLRRMSDD